LDNCADLWLGPGGSVAGGRRYECGEDREEDETRRIRVAIGGRVASL